MKKMMSVAAAFVMVFSVASSSVWAGGLATKVGSALVGDVVGEAADGLGQVVGAGADWAQEEIHGGKYGTYVNGDLEVDIYSKIAKVETGQDAYVSVGSVTLKKSRFKGDVTIDSHSNIGTIRAEDSSVVDVSSVYFNGAHINGDTDISTTSIVKGGIRAGKGSVVRIGDFKAY